MKIVEYNLIGIFIVGFIMNLFFLTGGGLLLLLSAFCLALMFYPGGLFHFNELPLKAVFKKETYAGLSAMRIIGSIGAGIALSLICIGILFRLQSWPGAEINLLLGLILLSAVLLIAAFKYRATNASVYRSILSRAIVYGLVGLFLYFTSSNDIERFRYRNHPEYLEIYEHHLLDPENPELWKQLEEAHDKVASRD